MKKLGRAMALACLGVLLMAPVMAFQKGNYSKQPAPPPGDTTLPTVWIETPPANATVVGRSVEVTFFAFDAGGLAKFELYVDHQLRKTISATTKSLAFQWRTRKDSEGPHCLEVVAYDRSGNNASSPEISVILYK